jgi:predicted secreted protein
MTLGIAASIAIYLTIWWTVLFAILPFGVTSHHEAGIDLGDGGDPGAPVDPKLKKKFITTSWISAILFAILWLVLRFHLAHLPSLPSDVH